MCLHVRRVSVLNLHWHDQRRPSHRTSYQLRVDWERTRNPDEDLLIWPPLARIANPPRCSLLKRPLSSDRLLSPLIGRSRGVFELGKTSPSYMGTLQLVISLQERTAIIPAVTANTRIWSECDGCLVRGISEKRRGCFCLLMDFLKILLGEHYVN
jgi:hypothetical protein